MQLCQHWASQADSCHTPKTHAAATELASLLGGSTGVVRHERSEERLGYRNGYRPGSLATQMSDIDLLIPKLQVGGFMPSIFKPSA
jgi:transposase-like protein